MRPGSGDDPFADESDDEASEETDDPTPESREESDVDARANDPSRSRSEETTGSETVEPIESETTSNEETDTGTDTDSGASVSDGLPYIYRRDRVQDERSGVTFYLRDDTRDREEAFVATLEEELGEDVYVADAREAALEAAFRNPQLAVKVLREYGYDFE
ncbi:hypothetical protein RYH80_19465 [Halobaculum sp. MBLA0147]|uniref:hypothetical protein n=1 Tax=Halobaculum sp. MBLA0147 TaxID=3079934 RepID=UPI0035235B6D